MKALTIAIATGATIAAGLLIYAGYKSKAVTANNIEPTTSGLSTAGALTFLGLGGTTPVQEFPDATGTSTALTNPT